MNGLQKCYANKQLTMIAIDEGIFSMLSNLHLAVDINQFPFQSTVLVNLEMIFDPITNSWAHSKPCSRTYRFWV